jgi:hypothetical protein
MGDTMTVTYGAYRIKLTATHLQKGGYKGAFILIDTRGGKSPTATTVEGAGTCSSPEEALAAWCETSWEQQVTRRRLANRG